MQNVTDRTSNPFGMRPDCDRYVPGYGDANADFHVIGDHPGVHGGTDSLVPFVDMPWSRRFLTALADAGLLNRIDGDHDADPDGHVSGDVIDVGSDLKAGDTVDGSVREPYAVHKTFLSYLHMCVADGTPPRSAYVNLERFFDAELRAIAAHVLLPVGARATDHVLHQYTARAWKTELDMDALHGREILGAGWLVVPIKDPAEWDPTDDDRLVSSIRTLRRTDFHRETDLGRFIAGDEPYYVR